VKNELLALYNAQVATLSLQMSHGRSIAKCACVGNVVDIRASLDALRPAEQRMAGELDRLVALTQTSRKGEVNEPRARPHMMTRVEATADLDQQVQTSSKTGIYVPPKVVPMHYSRSPLSRSVVHDSQLI